jgi:thiamine kinase-like enzyme
MDNFLDSDTDTFIHDKALEMFRTLNHIDFKSDDVEIKKYPLSGISNTIYRVEINYINQVHYNGSVSDGSSTNLTLFPKIKIDKIFFKIFGRISVLVDRELETYIMQQLYELGVGPKIYETDMKTYRIEEYIDNCVVLEREIMLNEQVYPKVINLFCSLSAFGDFKFYFDYVNDQPKKIFFEKLKNDTKTNFVNFTLNKMRPLGMKSFYDFKEKFFNHKKGLEGCSDSHDSLSMPTHLDEKTLFRMEYLLENLEQLFYDVCPEKGILVINHNDAHPLNILHDPENKKIVLCDFEYSTYNILGFDIANYLIESLFLLQADSFPFYQYYSKTNNEELNEDKYYNIYLMFFDKFEAANEKLFTDFKGFKTIIEQCRTKEYYYRLIGLSSLFWFVFAVIYLDYDSLKNKAGYDYFNFAMDRVNVYDKFVRAHVQLKDSE